MLEGRLNVAWVAQHLQYITSTLPPSGISATASDSTHTHTAMLASIKSKFNSLSKTAKVGIVLLFACAIGGAGYYGYKNYYLPKYGQAAALPDSADATSDPAIEDAGTQTEEAAATEPTTQANTLQPKNNAPGSANGAQNPPTASPQVQAQPQAKAPEGGNA